MTSPSIRLDALLDEATASAALDEAQRSLKIGGVQFDSRAVKPQDLFVAIPGLTVDGHDYAEAAVAAGAAAVIASRALSLSVPCVVVDDPARALGFAAARFHQTPAEAMTLVGITGTNGKTTTSYLIEHILRRAGRSPGLLGTVSYRYAGRVEPAEFTTPMPTELQALLRRMVDAGCREAVMEVSSHALQMGRVWGCSFGVAAFSHLTQDHLDLHGDMQAYLAAKTRLFSRYLRPGGTAVINVDGAGSDAIVEACRARGDVTLLRCSQIAERPAEMRIEGLRCDLSGLEGTLRLGDRRVAIHSPLLGDFNADNILLAAGCARALGLSLEEIAAGVEAQPGVPGRLERVESVDDRAVLVDYAHTPDALARAIATLRPLCRGRLTVIFGCGGDRDREKRPLMGAAAAAGADLAVVTSDNPRNEDPHAIIEAILAGMRRQGLEEVDSFSATRGYYVEPDRRRAIAGAVAASGPGDIVLIAGKGHEDYQILGQQKVHFDDREEARRALGLRARTPTRK